MRITCLASTRGAGMYVTVAVHEPQGHAIYSFSVAAAEGQHSIRTYRPMINDEINN